MSCTRSDAFLKARKLAVRETVDATRERFGAADLATVLGDARRVVVSCQRKVLIFERARDSSWPVELAPALLGPSGNLRAPALRFGSTWLVGFDEAAYRTELGG